MVDEVLTQVTETTRDDGQISLHDDDWCENSKFVLNLSDGVKINFNTVDNYFLGEGEEYASLTLGGYEVAYFSSRDELEIPHWVFEELGEIYDHGSLRPTDYYETNYSVKEKHQRGR
jgi:hypothetical protein